MQVIVKKAKLNRKFAYMKDTPLSLNNPCFQCNILVIMNSLVSHTSEIRFHDVIYRTAHMFTS